MRLAFGLVLLLLSTVLVQGEILLSDSFDFSDGPLVSASGSQWGTHSGTTGQVDVVSGRVFLTQSETEDVNAAFAANSASAFYASFTLNFSTLPGSFGYFAHLKTSGNSTFQGKLFATNSPNAGFFRLGIANTANSPAVVLSSDLALNTNYKIVLRYVVSSASTTLWLNPAVESDFSISASDTVTPAVMTAFAFRQTSGMGELFVDDLKVGTAFNDVVPPPSNTPPSITKQPESQAVAEGGTVQFSVGATGAAPLVYQWFFNGTNLASANGQTLTISNANTNQSGNYWVVITNAVGAVTSAPATLTVSAVPVYTPSALSVLTYNVKGNGATNWSTNSLQVQAIGRQVAYLQPDVITFNEIPFSYSYEMTNFLNAFLPNYFLAGNSGTDGSIRSVIASRFPITRSQKWLDGIDLKAFGYTNANGSLDNFSRDLFEAQIAVPGFSQPLHVFTTHLKAFSDTDSAAKRAAEASAVSNFFVTAFLTTNANRPYILTGDMNEDVNRPPSTSQQPIQRLANSATGLQLTLPRNPFNNDDRTISIQSGMNARFDYILPCALLFSNIQSSQVFRTDLLNPTPPAVQKFDDKDASDHLPVLMVFNNPYTAPFKISSIARNNTNFVIAWQSVPGARYNIETSATLESWTAVSQNFPAASYQSFFTNNAAGNVKFFRISIAH